MKKNFQKNQNTVVLREPPSKRSRQNCLKKEQKEAAMS
jgi:hypothetical protein